jgi:hypothetical protein
MQIAGRRTETVPRQPQIDIARLDAPNLGQLARWPLPLDSSHDEAFSLNRFRLLVLNGFKKAVAQFSQSQLSL